MTKTQRFSPTVQAAAIGLVGTLLTICGGLTGAGISAAATIYGVERERQQVALEAPTGNRSLNINTGSIFISRQEAASLDPQTYFVDLEQGFVIHRPLAGWNALEMLTVEEQVGESGIRCQVLCDQPVARIRYGKPLEVQTDRQAVVNDRPVPEERLAILEQLYGPPPWTTPYYSQATVNIFEKPASAEAGIRNLPDLLLSTTLFSSARFNRLIAEKDSGFMMPQATATYENVRLSGQETTFSLESWLLFAETDKAYYTVEIVFMPQSGHSLQVWEDLQTYMDTFRVVK